MNSKTTEAREKIRVAELSIHSGSFWKHYKGGVYQIDLIALDTTNGEACVLYQRVDGPDFDSVKEADIYYSRPFSEWFDTIEVDMDGTTYTLQRFVEVKRVKRWEEVNA
jgi:hypothetical protein